MNKATETAARQLTRLSKNMSEAETKIFFTNMLYFCLDRRSPNGYVNGESLKFIDSAMLMVDVCN